MDITIENDIHSIDYMRFDVSAKLPPSSFFFTSFYIYCYWIHCIIGSPVCELIYSISLYSPTFSFFFSFLLAQRRGGLYRREDVERSESSKLAARAQRAVSRFSDRGQSAQQF